MSSAFLNMTRTLRDRNFGGTSGEQVAEPYVSGYHFTKWYMPSSLTPAYMSFGMNDEMGTLPDGAGDAANILAATCLAVTPPGGTLNKTEHIGLGGVKWSTPTNIDYGNSLSCKFLEMSGLPVLGIIGGWCKLIRDNKIGLADLSGINYAKNNYAATVFYWTTKPDGHTLEYCACYSGVFPTKDPQDLFSGDLSSVDKLEMDIDFNVDFVYHEDWVVDKCWEFASEGANKETSAMYQSGFAKGRYSVETADKLGGFSGGDGVNI